MPPQTTKVCKRTNRKTPLKGVLKNKLKTNNGEKKKLLIKKIIGIKNKKITSIKSDNQKNVKTPSKVIIPKSISKNNTEKTTRKLVCDKKSRSSEKPKSTSPQKIKKKLNVSIIPPTCSKTVSKTVKVCTVSKLKKLNQNKINVNTKKMRSSTIKERVCKKDSAKPSIRSKESKTTVKKVSDSTQSICSSKKDKDRSRSPEKKRSNITRSSSAPLLPVNTEMTSKEPIKSLVLNRNSKTTSGNSIGTPHSPHIVNKTCKKSTKTSDSTKECSAKLKDVDVKDGKIGLRSSNEKICCKIDTIDSEKNSMPVENPVESKILDTKYSDVATKTFLNTPVLSPLGRKKTNDIVRPIARVKGTIIEKRVDLEKRKLTPSPAKNIEEKSVSEKNTHNIEKLKTEMDKKKDSCQSTKVSDDNKKQVIDKDQAKTIKAVKKSEIDKSTTADITKNVMIVQPDTSCYAVDTVKDDKSTNKPCKEKSTNLLPVKKTVKRTNSKLLNKKKLKSVPKCTRPLSRKILVVKKRSVLKKKMGQSDKSSQNKTDTRIISHPDSDNKLEINSSSNIETCKTSTIKSSKSKIKENVPKKVRTEPKENEETDDKESSKKTDIRSSSPGVSSANANANSDNEQKLKIFNKELKTDVPIQHDVKITSADKGSKIKTNKRTEGSSSSESEVDEKSLEKHEDEIKKEKSADKLRENITDSDNSSKSDMKKETKPYVRSPHSISRPSKKYISLPSDDSRRRKKLHGFWTGPKRHREASLNALAKVQCLYENESRSHLELGLMKTTDKSKSKDYYRKKFIKTEKRDSTSSESEYETRVKTEMTTSSEEDVAPPITRTLRCQPRGAGKYWEMKISSSEESEVEFKRRISEKKKIIYKPKPNLKSEPSKIVSTKPQIAKDKKHIPVKKRRKRTELVMDLRDMVVKKRMASLNATAILAASYEKRSPRSGRDETTSSESGVSEQEELLAKKCKINIHTDKNDAAKKDYSSKNGDIKSAAKSKVEVIVNQEADVTITGVYSTHHEGFCTVSGMQYRISATSHTQTTATTSKDNKEMPPRNSGGVGYTPLGALSSMHPPGGGSPHIHQGSSVQDSRVPLIGSLGRKAGCSSAFSAPHHHSDADRPVPPGYYQPAGPLITATPLHGGFKDNGTLPSLSTEQSPQYGRYSYAQPQQVIPYSNSFASQYGAPHAHYGGGEVCYGASRASDGSLVLAAPSCYRPTATHRTAPSFRHPPIGPGTTTMPPTPHDAQLSSAASDTFGPQYCPPCYQHPHTPPRAPIACLDAAYQGPCPCPMQSCPKNVLTGPATGNPSSGGGPNSSSPPGGSRAPLQTTIGYCMDDKRKKISINKNPPLLNQVLKNECNVKNSSEMRNTMCSVMDNNNHFNGRSPKREYFSEQVGSRARQEVNEGRSGCCAVAINPSLGVIPPEALGPPSPARGSAGATIPQPPDPPHPNINTQSIPISSQIPSQRRARIGKSIVRKSTDDNVIQTSLLMCQPNTLSTEFSQHITSPLQIVTENSNQENVDSFKNENDAADDVILIDSPSCKVIPIDLSSSEENGADNKSDCIIIRAEENSNIIDLSKENKIEDQPVVDDNSLVLAIKPSKIPITQENKCENNLDNSKKNCEVKIKVGTKRRCSQPKLEIDIDCIADNLGANGIGEHVKLQKRQKNLVTSNVQITKKNTGSYKDLIKKPEKIFRLNNGKRQLNTLRNERTKMSSKTINLIDTDKTSQKNEIKKTISKRKVTSPSNENSPITKRKKLTSSLLKYTDKKQHTRHYEELIAEKSIDGTKSKIVPLMPKNKSAILIENIIMKNNNIDPVIENVDKNIVENSEENDSLRCHNKSTLKMLGTSCSKKMKKCVEINSNSCENKNKTILNINNNVVKNIDENVCSQVSLKKNDMKLSISERSRRTKSKSPAALSHKTERGQMKSVCDTKAKNQLITEIKDLNTKVVKLENTKNKKCKNRLVPLVKNNRKKSKSIEANEKTTIELPLRRFSTPRWSNGWTWEGEPQQGKVYVNNEESCFMAMCYSGMRHDRAGDAVRRGDCVLLRSGNKRSEAPFVARVTQLWENPTDGEMMVSLLWYYRPEHTESGRQSDDCAEEVFASRHRDVNSVACIEDKCYVLTFNEYCRYRKLTKAAEENITSPISIVPSMPVNEVTPAIATNDGKVPLNISPDLVLFCRRVYDFRLKKIFRPPY